MKPFRLTLIGRPNVGKSSLYNALLGYRRTIVLDMPGTTRDAIIEKAKWEGRTFELCDSQGIFSEDDSSVLKDLLTKTDAIYFVVDSKAGLTPFDLWLAREVELANKPTLLVVNKVDFKGEEEKLEFSQL